jgi:hypothetical protein
MVQKDGPVGTFRENRLIQFAGQKFRENWKLLNSAKYLREG